jgi:glutamate-1-semialdehyde aminotransferase
MIQELERTDALEVAAGRAEAIRAGWQELARGFRLAVQVTGTSSWLGLSFTNTPIGSVRDTLTADRRYQLAFSLGLLANGVYIAPSHPGFTSAAHSESDVEYVLEASERVLADLAAAR